METTFEINPFLVRKYNRPVPRYTSYPTVPFWRDDFQPKTWKNIFEAEYNAVNHTKGISLYIHLPFCESLCTYCGCNKKITTNHNVENEYLEAVEKEWKLYRKLMKQTPVIREIHLGGGTPTFFSPANLNRLLSFILRGSVVHPQHEFSIEGHPNNTTLVHLNVLHSLGFRRISFGVQDNDPEVQKVINRIQPFENLQKATENTRAVGFTSVNFDLIYGLPLQTLDSIKRTFEQVLTLRPDRIAFYSYAHVPWTSKAQRLFDESSLPTAEEKIGLYLKGKQMLLANGYHDIGMDHFALPGDTLYLARKAGRLHRNFMGYTTHNSGLLLGLGVSSISDAGVAYVQNSKTNRDYYAAVNSGDLAIKKGYVLNREDQLFQKNILDISCRGVATVAKEQSRLFNEYTRPQLQALKEDGLVEFDAAQVKLTDKGHYFIRNVCSAFDLHLQRSRKEMEPKVSFSKAI
jgi:oxygen-independent coproporphyrinogen-3 oxidase